MTPGDTDAETCHACGDPRPPDGTGAVLEGRWRPLCPACEDVTAAARDHDYPPGDPTGAGRVPPHGNTTRWPRHPAVFRKCAYARKSFAARAH